MDSSIVSFVEDKFQLKLKPFQAAVYEKALNDQDVFVCAPTGSGKTFCFAFLSATFDEKDRRFGSITLLPSELLHRHKAQASFSLFLSSVV